MNCKANVFTRVLPTYESITKAFGSCIKNSNIAILEPSKNNKSILEKKTLWFLGDRLYSMQRIWKLFSEKLGEYSFWKWDEVIFG